MIKSKEDLLKEINNHLGEDTSDETLTLIENITDTLNDYENKSKSDGKDWKAEATRIDNEWRKKYRDRFFNSNADDDDDSDDDSDDNEVLTFEKLFKEE